MSSRPRRRVRQYGDEIPSPRPRKPRERRFTLAVGIVVGVLLLILIGLVIGVNITNDNPEAALTLQLGGPSHNNDATPRNFRLWTAYPDGRIRFQAAYFPVTANAPASAVMTIAGPLVNQPTDIQSVSYFGALHIAGALQVGPGSDASRVYQLFSVEPDPGSQSYGVNVVVANAPYVSVDKDDGQYRQLAMGAPTQNYYTQMIWALALPPGSTISSSSFKVSTDSAPSMLKPYRRVNMDGWLVYYFDVTSLDSLYTIRIRYLPPAADTKVGDPDFWKADRLR